MMYTPTRKAILAALATVALCFNLPALADDGNPLQIEADELLEWDQTAGTYIARGAAVARQGTTEINADSLTASYDPAAPSRRIQKIVAIGNVTYKAEGTSATGAKLIYDIAGSTYLIEGKNAKINSPSGTMSATQDINYDASDPANKIIIARGAALYRDAQNRIIAGERIVGFMDKDSALQTLDAETNVKVVTVGGQTATGDAVTYNYATSKAVLTGNVEILDGANIMRGGRAEVDFNSGISRILSDGSGKRVSGVLGQ